MDPRQFVRNSNVEIKRSNTLVSTQSKNVPVFTELRVGKFRPGIYNGVVNRLFTKDESRLDIKDILKQKPKGHAPITGGITVDVNEIKGIYGRFQKLVWQNCKTVCDTFSLRSVLGPFRQWPRTREGLYVMVYTAVEKHCNV